MLVSGHWALLATLLHVFHVNFATPVIRRHAITQEDASIESGEVQDYTGPLSLLSSTDPGEEGPDAKKEEEEPCNWKCYLERYPDLQTQFGVDETNAHEHFEKFGRAQRRSCHCATDDDIKLFEKQGCNWKCYQENYADLVRFSHDNNTNLMDLAKHYQNYGIREDRDCTCPSQLRLRLEEQGCDWQCYLKRYPELGKFSMTLNGAANHYVYHGMKEGRICSCSLIEGKICYEPLLWGMPGGAVWNHDPNTCRQACFERKDCHRIAYADRPKLSFEKCKQYETTCFLYKKAENGEHCKLGPSECFLTEDIDRKTA